MKFLSVPLTHKLFSIIATSPILLSVCYGQRKKFKTLVVNQQTNIVIEGFPRSANTFAVIAFKQAQKNDYIIAHHLHAEAQFKLALKYNIPAIALIREPLDAVCSLLIRDSNCNVDQALLRYIKFYTVVKKLSNQLLIAKFSEVTQDFNKTITRCNDKFSTGFLPFANTEQGMIKNTNKVFNEIKIINQKKELGNINMLAMPSQKKDNRKSVLKTEIALNPLFTKANKLFNCLKDL